MKLSAQRTLFYAGALLVTIVVVGLMGHAAMLLYEGRALQDEVLQEDYAPLF